MTVSDTTKQYNGPHNPWLETVYMTNASNLRAATSWARFGSDISSIFVETLLPNMRPHYQRVNSYLNANATLLERLTNDYPKPHFNLPTTTVNGSEVTVTENVVEQLPFCNLIHFHRDLPETTPGTQPRILLVAPQSGHYATLLRPTVERLLPETDVYVTDWVNARDVPPESGYFGLETYADYLQHFLTLLGPGTHVISICQSTVPTVMAASRLTETAPDLQPATITLMAGPLDPAAAPTQVTELADKMDLNSHLSKFITVAPNGRHIYPGYIQLASFVAMNPEAHMSSHRDLYKHYVADNTHPDVQRIEKFYNEYFAVSDLPAEFYQETVQRVFIDKELANGNMTYHGTLVDPSVLTCPIIAVEGEIDDISAPGQTLNFLRHFTNSTDITYHNQPGSGHYGVFAGGNWRNTIAPKVLAKIVENTNSS